MAREKLDLRELRRLGFPRCFTDNMGRNWELSPNGHSFEGYALSEVRGDGELPACADYVVRGFGGEVLAEANFVLGHPAMRTREEKALEKVLGEKGLSFGQGQVEKELGRSNGGERRRKRKKDEAGRMGRRGGWRG